MSTPTPVIAYLLLNGKPTQTCLDCSEFLFARGMLQKVHECQISDLALHDPKDNVFTSVIYEVAPTYTFEDCKAAVKGRHG